MVILDSGVGSSDSGVGSLDSRVGSLDSWVVSLDSGVGSDCQVILQLKLLDLGPD